MRWLGCALLLVAGCGGPEAVPEAPTPPIVFIRSEATGEVKAPFTVQFFFSAPVSFNSESGTLPFSLSGARIVEGTFAQVNADTWQVTLAPDANRRGLVDLRVPAGAFVDQKTRLQNRVAFEFAQPFNTLAPFARLEFTGPTDALRRITGAGRLDLRFDAVLDQRLPMAAFTCSAGELGALQRTSADGQKDSYALTFAPPAMTAGGVTCELAVGSVSAGGITNLRDWWTFGLATP